MDTSMVTGEAIRRMESRQGTDRDRGIRKEIKEWALAVGALLFLVSGPVFAQATGTDVLGGGICALVKILTGKWLFGLAILATLGAGAALLFGAELTEGIKKLCTIITVVGMILAMTFILTTVFGAAVTACGP